MPGCDEFPRPADRSGSATRSGGSLLPPRFAEAALEVAGTPAVLLGRVVTGTGTDEIGGLLVVALFGLVLVHERLPISASASDVTGS